MSQDSVDAADTALGWLMEIGLQADELLRQPGVKDRFQAMLTTWIERCLRQQRGWKKWQDQRECHAQEARILHRQHLDESTEPPGDGWRYQQHAIHEVLADGSCRSRVVGVWFPPDLIAEAEPHVDSPLSFCGEYADPGCNPNRSVLQLARSLSLPEKYALCCAIRDLVCRVAEPIGPRPDAIGTNAELNRAATVYQSLCDDVASLRKGDLPVVKVILRDVMEDCASSPTPYDLSGHVLASQIVNRYSDRIPGLNIKMIHKILDNNPSIRSAKRGRRLYIHEGDWIAFVLKTANDAGAGTEESTEPSPEVIQERARTIRTQRWS